MCVRLTCNQRYVWLTITHAIRNLFHFHHFFRFVFHMLLYTVLLATASSSLSSNCYLSLFIVTMWIVQLVCLWLCMCLCLCDTTHALHLFLVVSLLFFNVPTHLLRVRIVENYELYGCMFICIIRLWVSIYRFQYTRFNVKCIEHTTHANTSSPTTVTILSHYKFISLAWYHFGGEIPCLFVCISTFF